MEVISGAPVTEVAGRYGVTRQPCTTGSPNTGQRRWCRRGPCQ